MCDVLYHVEYGGLGDSKQPLKNVNFSVLPVCAKFTLKKTL